MKLIVGLGNPGKKYAMTKHNIGFMSVDYFANKNQQAFKQSNKCLGEICKIKNNLLLKPNTFMNRSGASIKATMEYYGISLDDVLIIYDDLALPLGKLRLRKQGSSGGHNGVKSIIEHIKTDSFMRVRIGIDQNPLYDTADYVLSKFTPKEVDTLLPIFDSMNQLFIEFLNDTSFETLMNKYNGVEPNNETKA